VRNGCLAAAKTYLRPLFLLPVIFCVPVLTVIGTQHETTRTLDHIRAIHNDARLRQAGKAFDHLMENHKDTLLIVDSFEVLLRALFFASVLGCLGATMSIHLKQMLGNPHSRFMPGLQRAQLTIAGILSFLFVITMSFVLSATVSPFLGARDVSVVCAAFSLAVFAIAVSLTHFFPNAIAFLFCMAMLMPLIGETRSAGGAVRLPSTLESLLIISFSIACLASIVWRLTRLNEEMPEYHRRFDTTGQQRGPIWPVPSRAIRSWRRRTSPMETGIVWRASHWGAARAPIIPAVGIGLGLGVVVGGVAGFVTHASIPQLIGSPNIPCLAAFPAFTALGLQNRRYLEMELLRPLSRDEHVRAIGLALAACVSTSWLFMLVTSSVVLWFAGTAAPSIGSLLPSAVFSACCLPLIFGIAAWPYKTSAAYYAYTASFGIMGSFALLPLDVGKFSPAIWGLGSIGLLAAGLFVTKCAYVRWLNFEFTSNSSTLNAGVN
jgi:hypothetical protein